MKFQSEQKPQSVHFQSILSRTIIAGAGLYIACLILAVVIMFLSIRNFDPQKFFGITVIVQIFGTITGFIVFLAVIYSEISSKP